ncbi:MAG: serine/threonine-protein phosphatase [Melioribacteraceae bacterium]|nr:serine/threonine-protein phosphatase [Melioribacteraceae bacterium]MCF8352851.1 serine/threonine-protein phosphatase [Melioribacteraceae bacterium]MCF8417368.1 serine/threonine-protein phosphatase [Melioribacteraceae bacterium]
MQHKKILRTIETVASKKFSSEKELLTEVLNLIVKDDQFSVTGGRLWKLDTQLKAYRLVYQLGNVQHIEDDFILKVDDYPVFNIITRERTVLANETNQQLIEKGIFRYSASGIGYKTKIDGKYLYQYLLAVNSEEIDDDLRYTLNIVATVVTSKIKERSISDSRKNLIMDLDKAKHLIRSILPEHEYHFHNYVLFGITIPAQILGGDFYDYLKIGDDESRIAIAVGDAASKGVSAAAEAMYISGALRMASTFQMKISPMMYRMNELINKIFSDDRFASLFYCELSNDKKGICLYANAGHNPPILFSNKDKSISYLQPTGPLLGPAPHSKYDTDSMIFEKGDILIIYSDGVTEAANDDFDFYEEERLEKVIRKVTDLSPKEIALTILDDVEKFSTSNSKYQDDKTIVVIKRKDN